MTGHSPSPTTEGDDHTQYEFHYGHGRMPLFMKVVWIGFIIGATWYVVQFLLSAVSKELG